MPSNPKDFIRLQHIFDAIEEIEKYREIFYMLKRSLSPLKEALYTIKTIKEDDDFNGIEKSNFTTKLFCLFKLPCQ